MRYIVDHDLHIHSRLSYCSNDPEQNTEAILRYGEKCNFRTLCLADHMWDAAIPGAVGFYAGQDYTHIAEALPLPQSDKVRFLFGCETEIDRNLTLGISREVIDKLDFVIIPTTHLHMSGFTCEGNEDAEARAKLWIARLDRILNMDLPFHKIGIAHLTCVLMHPGHHVEVLKAISADEYHRLFAKAARLGVGIELNCGSCEFDGADRELQLLPYRIAKEEGCKFYFGSDAHHPNMWASAKAKFEEIVDLLGLIEDDKFLLSGM